MPAHGVTLSSRSPVDRRALVRNAALVGVIAILALGLLLAARRLAGGLTTVLPAPQLLVVAAVVAAVIVGSRLAPTRSGAEPWFDQFIGWGGSLALVLVYLGCSYPGDRVSHWLIWAPLLVADQFLRHAFLTAAPRSAPTAPVRTESTPAEDHVIQQLTRVRDAAGAELIRGTLRADFLAGQRHATVHVGFCPPLAALPEIAAEPVDGPDATIKIVQALAHGARLDLRLEDPADEPCQVTIDFTASPHPGGTL